eukprot:972986-Prorocentrum_minimum.AAC.2
MEDNHRLTSVTLPGAASRACFPALRRNRLRKVVGRVESMISLLSGGRAKKDKAYEEWKRKNGIVIPVSPRANNVSHAAPYVQSPPSTPQAAPKLIRSYTSPAAASVGRSVGATRVRPCYFYSSFGTYRSSSDYSKVRSPGEIRAIMEADNRAYEEFKKQQALAASQPPAKDKVRVRQHADTTQTTRSQGGVSFGHDENEEPSSVLTSKEGRLAARHEAYRNHAFVTTRFVIVVIVIVVIVIVVIVIVIVVIVIVIVVIVIVIVVIVIVIVVIVIVSAEGRADCRCPR